MSMIDGVSNLINATINTNNDVANAVMKNGLATPEEALDIAKIVATGLAKNNLDKLKNSNASEITRTLKTLGDETKNLENSVVATITHSNS